MSGASTPPAAALYSSYKYTPLTDPQSIRILSLQPGQGGDPLLGRLSVENLASKPEYETISYVWGGDGRCAELHVVGDDGNGQRAVLPLTESACDALRRMRLPTRPRRLWADQVCINQSDVTERSHQVSLMNAIYKNARHVLVWLGRDERGTAEGAVKMVDHLDEIFADEEKHEAFRVKHSGDLSGLSKEPWIPLSVLTGLPWFNRLWIVQEIGTVAPATLFWGDCQIDWEKLSRVAVVLNQGYHHLRTHFRVLTPNIRYLYKRFIEPDEDYDENHNRGSFIYELHRARHLLAKDPRDHVYAFLGHFSINKGSKALAEIKVDYSRSVEDVYLDVAIRDLSGASGLLLLSACHTVHADKMKRSSSFPIEPLPSWVPDWRLLPLHIMGSPTTLHRAGGDTKPRLTIDEARRVLHIKGVRVDTVARMSFTFFGNAFRSARKALKRPPIQTLWEIVCGYKDFNLDERYLNGDAAFFAFVQTLTNACIGGDRASDYRPMSPAECLANGAAFLVRSTSFEKSTDVEVSQDDKIIISPELRAIAAGGNHLQWSHEATLVTRHRRFAVTTKGYFVMGPDSMVEGDALVVLYGGKMAFALRESRDGWILLGECYVHGLMNGEALDMEGAEEETFSIR